MDDVMYNIESMLFIIFNWGIKNNKIKNIDGLNELLKK